MDDLRKMMRHIPQEGKKPFGLFLTTYVVSILILLVLFGWLYYRSVLPENYMTSGGSTVAFLGLILTTSVGASAIRCISRLSSAEHEEKKKS